MVRPGCVSGVKYGDDKVFLSVDDVVVAVRPGLLSAQIPVRIPRQHQVAWVVTRTGQRGHGQPVLQGVQERNVDIRRGRQVSQHSRSSFRQPHKLRVKPGRPVRRYVRVWRCLRPNQQNHSQCRISPPTSSSFYLRILQEMLS